MLFNEHKTIASHYARQLEDWLRVQKEVDFNALALRNGSFCFNNTTLGTSWSPTSCGYTGLNPQIYQRQVVLTPSGGSPPLQVDVLINVSWQEHGQTYVVPLRTLFRVFEET